MANVTVNFVYTYNVIPAGDLSNCVLTGDFVIPPTSLDDGNSGDNQFSTTDLSVSDGLFLGAPGSGTGDYLGTWTDGNGQVFYAFTNDTQADLVLYGAAAASPSAPPATIDATDTSIINPAAVTVLCFAAGTQIKTRDGSQAVETLAIGDMLRTADGHDVAVKWIGRQTTPKLFSSPHMQPVRIRAGALGGGLPHNDLTLTADHGMVIDGMVINASALVNGHSIDFVPLAELEDSFTVYHIETENHDVIFANGAPSETFVDAQTRSHFDNYDEYLNLYGVERIIPEMNRPRISAARLLPQAIKDRLQVAQAQDAATAAA